MKLGLKLKLAAVAALLGVSVAISHTNCQPVGDGLNATVAGNPSRPTQPAPGRLAESLCLKWQKCGGASEGCLSTVSESREIGAQVSAGYTQNLSLEALATAELQSGAWVSMNKLSSCTLMLDSSQCPTPGQGVESWSLGLLNQSQTCTGIFRPAPFQVGRLKIAENPNYFLLSQHKSFWIGDFDHDGAQDLALFLNVFQSQLTLFFDYASGWSRKQTFDLTTAASAGTSGNFRGQGDELALRSNVDSRGIEIWGYTGGGFAKQNQWSSDLPGEVSALQTLPQSPRDWIVAQEQTPVLTFLDWGQADPLVNRLPLPPNHGLIGFYPLNPVAPQTWLVLQQYQSSIYKYSGAQWERQALPSDANSLTGIDAIEIADVNGDGQMDWITANYTLRRFEVRLAPQFELEPTLHHEAPNGQQTLESLVLRIQNQNETYLASLGSDYQLALQFIKVRELGNQMATWTLRLPFYIQEFQRVDLNRDGLDDLVGMSLDRKEILTFIQAPQP